MSAFEGLLSPGSSAAPPSSVPAAAPPVAPSPPAAAPATPVDSAAVGPESASSDVVAAIPGALPSEPAAPKTLDEARQRYFDQIEGKLPEGAQPEAAAAEAQPTEVTEPPVEAQPVEEAEPVIEPVETAPEAPVEAEGEDTDYLESVRSAEEIASRYARKLNKNEIADFAKREAHRGELLKQVNTIGGDLGVQIASVINPIILGKENPTEDDVDAIFDQIVLPENAGAGKLFDLMGKRLVNTQLQEETCGSCQSDGRVANSKCTDHIPMGKEFASGMIGEEYGKNVDGTPFDFRGMKPIELVDLLMRAAKAKDDEGEPLLNVEFYKQELEGKGKPAPTENELRLQKENEELRQSTAADRQAKEAEQTREREQANVRYQTEARGVVSAQIMKFVTPLAQKANWALADGEEGESAQEKKELGELITDHINMKLMGTAGNPSPEYAEVQEMIDNRTAFDPATGLITPRFRLKLEKLQTQAKALFNRKQVALNSRFKFSAATSRNAQLVAKNGSKAGAQQPATEAPPLAAAPKPPADRPLTAVEKLAQVEKEYYDSVAAQRSGVGVR